MIFSKNLKEKRLLFIVLMTVEYYMLKRIFSYDIWFQVLYVGLMYVILKILYKEKAQITDIFTFMIGSFILFIISGISYVVIFATSKQFIASAILSRVLMILFLIVFKNKLHKTQYLYKKLWNRNDKTPKKMKSITFRCVNLVLFNFMFYLANIIMLFIINGNGGV